MKSKWEINISVKVDENMLRRAKGLLDESQIVTIKTSRVYSQIARMGRQPNKSTEKKVLINALERASTKKEINGRIVSMEPPYVEMKSDEIKLCFERQLDRIIEDIAVETYVKQLSEN